jgi:D-beta-D-heptose 7-phosphate kinase/D-beta-D-heptose 1-phosphate adenosyltransferase
MKMNNALISLLEQFSSLRVLVLGDAMLDLSLCGAVSTICKDAPVPEVEVTAEETAPGGAAHTAASVAALGARSYFLGAVGGDREGRQLIETLQSRNVNTDLMITDPVRETLVKLRVFADNQMVVRCDRGTTISLPPAYEKEIIGTLQALYEKFDVILLTDHNYGTITDSIVEALQLLQSRSPRLLFIDSKDLRRFSQVHATCVKANYKELLQLLNKGDEFSSTNRVDQIIGFEHSLYKATGSSLVISTCDVEGTAILQKNKPVYRTYAKATQKQNHTGAGDVYMSAFALAFANGASVAQSSELASLAAQIAVEKGGTVFCSADELLTHMTGEIPAIISRDSVSSLVERYRSQGKTIVFTNGCFDILHSGHVTYLEKAKALGDVLIVGINSDESVRRLKGKTRPINRLSDRMRVLASLQSVDHVVSFDEDTPIELLRIVQPDMYVKGGDYTLEQLPEVPVVEEFGGKVALIPFVMDRSTTKIIERIRHTSSSRLTGRA